MVTRKPVPAPAGATAPYPVSPTSANPPSFSSAATSNQHSNEDDNPWGEETPNSYHEAPNLSTEKEIPALLRAGPPGLSRKSNEMNRPQTSSNPFRRDLPQSGISGGESSADAWGLPAMQSSAPPLIPQLHQNAKAEPSPFIDPPSTDLSKLSLTRNDTGGTSPCQPSLGQNSSPQPQIHPPLPREDSLSDPWRKPRTPSPPLVTTQAPNLIDLRESESPAWDEPGYEDDEVAPQRPITHETDLLQHDDQIWGEGKGKGKQAGVITPTEDVGPSDGWDLVNRDGILESEQESGIVTAAGVVLPDYPDEDSPPGLPPRPDDYRPPQPPRPTEQYLPLPGPPPRPNEASSSKQYMNETYGIKKIFWHDVAAEKNPRTSPILVQNANGPCPLLALVNALTLSTPADVNTGLVDALRAREQVTLGFLLDAVFDELMSGRRGDATQQLPDIQDMYSFLLALHTGMNVNPRFFPHAATGASIDARATSHVHASEREVGLPGTFEDTREMKLYSIFAVPLIHGWLPEPNSPEYAALFRSANSYEDAQNLMFHEEGLEEKLQGEGLSFQEQGNLEDISTIKAFFTSAATQLTTYGLQTITNSLDPGAVAILFRNDHFSTLYKHPHSLQLLQLVTDMGYASHEEVVWESLTDVNGEHAEFLSGDFRVVGASATPGTLNNNDEWITAGSKTVGQSQPHSEVGSSGPQMSSTEQEDHDMALALQLQEEEEQGQREEQARRKREQQLSQQYIEQQGSTGPNAGGPVTTRGGRGRARGSQASAISRPAVPARRSQAVTVTMQPPTVAARPADPEAGIDAPPPTYEQAATQEAYVPPEDHPAHPSSNPEAARRVSGASVPSVRGASSIRGGRGGRGQSSAGAPLRQQQGQTPMQKDKEDKCKVM